MDTSSAQMGSAAIIDAFSPRAAFLRSEAPSLSELPLFLRQIPDIVLEITSHLPTESAMCLALTCKPLYSLLFQSTLRKLKSNERHTAGFLYLLLKDLQQTQDCTYLCHHCSKLHRWRCPHGGLGHCEACPRIGVELGRSQHAGDQQHACITYRSYFTYAFKGVETGGDFSRWVMHRERGGFCSCCGKSPPRATNATST
ncbi:hypothetical protein LZ31DRAFT_596393 [Colletotrichum somersetense]|nr:hypothetical protein LZ31DRAFT_596393 [Colletotrichum somersetense]